MKHSLLLILVLAFLTLQWTTTHIHLAKHHDHGNGHHQHYSKVHSHQSIDKDIQVDDLTHEFNDLSIVELDHEFSHKKADILDEPDAEVLSATFTPFTELLLVNEELINFDHNIYSQFYSFTIEPRAPPQYA